MLKVIAGLLLFSTCNAVSVYAVAEKIDNKKLHCSARHLDTDAEVTVKVVPSIPGKKIATAQWPLGYPTIAIDASAFARLPKNAREFIYYHECAHLKFMSNDEHEVDCESMNLLAEHSHYSDIEVRSLIQELTKEFGWRKRWYKLLDCRDFQQAQ